MIKSKLGFIRGEGISDNSEDNETETNETEINEDNEEEINEDSETEIETEINEEGINEGIKEDIDEEEINEEDINEGVNKGDNKKVIVSKENRISDGFISEYGCRNGQRLAGNRRKDILLRSADPHYG